MTAATDDFGDLLAFVDAELDFATDYYDDAYLERRISARMRRRDAESFAAYRSLLVEDDEERTALLDALSINVTGFFRNPDAWRALAPILGKLTDERRTVRCWSAPCADGREPYTLAMLALDDDRVDERRVEILGTDINAEILETAREGVYEATRTTDLAEELAPLSDPDAYVERQGDTFRVREAVRDLVSFERHDLINGPAKTDYDLVCCRNLLIYIDPSYKDPIFDTIAHSLAPGGYLMLGMTETLPRDRATPFDDVDKSHRIYRKAESAADGGGSAGRRRSRRSRESDLAAPDERGGSR